MQWRSYQLDPSLPDHYDGTELDYLGTRKGMAPAQVAGMFAHVAEQARVKASTIVSTTSWSRTASPPTG